MSTQLQSFEISLRAKETKEDLLLHLVNQLPAFLGAEQAFFGQMLGSRFDFLEASAVADVNNESGYVQTIAAKVKETLGANPNVKALSISLDDQGRSSTLPFGLLLRLCRVANDPESAVILVRSKPWREPEIMMGAYLADVYAHALWGFGKPQMMSLRRARRLLPIGALALVMAMLFLVQARLSIIAPSRIVPTMAISVTAPIAGRIDKVLVAHGDDVDAGETLFQLDDQIAQDNLSSAQQNLFLAIARHDVLLKQALTDLRARQELSVAELEVRVAEVEVRSATHQLERHLVKADRSGTVLSEELELLVGGVVEVGQSLALLFTPSEVELEVDIPVADGLLAYDMTEARVFLNASPLNPLNLIPVRGPRTPRLDSRGGMSYPTRMAFTDPDPKLTVGMEGLVQILGPRKPLIYTLLRRPIDWIRVRLPVL